MTEKEFKLKQEYEEFIKTDAGKQWKRKWQEHFGSDNDFIGDFTDYLYDFHPEMLQ